jgi:hypothetical protein
VNGVVHDVLPRSSYIREFGGSLQVLTDWPKGRKQGTSKRILPFMRFLSHRGLHYQSSSGRRQHNLRPPDPSAQTQFAQA